MQSSFLAYYYQQIAAHAGGAGVVVGGALVVYILAAILVPVFLRRFVASSNPLHPSTTRIGGGKKARAAELTRTIRRFLRWMIAGIAGIMLLDLFGVRITPILTGAGIVGFGIALATQKITRDIVQGIFIITTDLYTVGDRVSVGRATGEVIHFTLMRTIIRDDKGNVYSIPNGEIGSVMTPTTSVTKD